VAAAHVDGTIHVDNLEQPLKLAWLTPSVEYLKRHGLRLPAPGLPEVADGARSLTAQLRAVAAAAPRYAADAVELIHAETFYAPLVAAFGPKELEAEAADLAALLAGPAGTGTPVHPTLHLHVPRALRRLRVTGPNATSLDACYGELAEPALRFARAVLAVLRNAPPTPRRTLAVGLDAQIFKDPARAAVLREACSLAASGNVLFLVDRGEDLLWPASRLGRFEPCAEGAAAPEESWLAAAQAVFVNLPQVAYRGAPGDLEGFYDRMDEAVDLAVKALQQKHAALRRYYGEAGMFGEQAGWVRDGRGALRLEEAVSFVVPVGLNEAVRHLAGRELGEAEEAAKAGLRVLSCLAFRVREAARRAGMRIVLGEYPAAEACARMARLDARRFAPARDRGGVENPPPYTPAYHCRADLPLALSDRLALESRFHTLFESGHVDLAFPPGVARGAHDIFTLLQRACLETKAAQVYVR
jgi:ribonucleoside-triphosphate reductase